MFCIGLSLSSDYELMQIAFSKPGLSRRGMDEQIFDAIKFQSKFYNIEVLAQTFGYTLEGTNAGIGMGQYTASHKSLRQKWHQTVMKMMSRNELENMIVRARTSQNSSTKA